MSVNNNDNNSNDVSFDDGTLKINWGVGDGVRRRIGVKRVVKMKILKKIKIVAGAKKLNLTMVEVMLKIAVNYFLTTIINNFSFVKTFHFERAGNGGDDKWRLMEKLDIYQCNNNCYNALWCHTV